MVQPLPSSHCLSAAHGVNGTHVFEVPSHSRLMKVSQPGGQIGCASTNEKSKQAGPGGLHSQQRCPRGNGGGGG
jgi:hypothetical protein